MIRSAVDLPQPEGPRRLTNSPPLTVSDMPVSAAVPLEKTLDTSFITTSARRCSGGGGVKGASERDIDSLGL